MKLIVDIPNNVYAKVMEYCEHNEIVEAVYGYIYRGIPLEQIRDEIENIEISGQVDEHTAFIRSGNEVKNIALDIIDKYMKEQTE